MRLRGVTADAGASEKSLAPAPPKGLSPCHIGAYAADARSHGWRSRQVRRLITWIVAQCPTADSGFALT
jgi:hypothetical protein